ncbi:MAG: hypothetical protein QXO25_07035, partial [Candidatus Bathyarchaeia archaeon]
IDGQIYGSTSVTLTSPIETLTVWTGWVAVEGYHSVSWLIDPRHLYNDPNPASNQVTQTIYVVSPQPQTYTAKISVSGLPPELQTKLTVDGEDAGSIGGGALKEYSFPLGSEHSVRVDEYVQDGADVRYHCPLNEWSFSDAGEKTFQYTAEYSVTVAVEPKVTEVTGSGWYCSGSEVKIKAPEVIEEGAGTKHIFSSWQYDSSALNVSELTLQVDRPFKVAAKYTTYHLLRVESEVGEATGGGWYREGEAAEFSVPSEVPMEGFWGLLGGRLRFRGWSGDIEVGTNMATVEMDSPKNVSAVWQPDYTLPYVVFGLAALAVTGGVAGYFGLSGRDPCTDLRRKVLEAEKKALDKEKSADEAKEDLEDAKRGVRRAEEELENAEKSRKDAEAAKKRAEKPPREDSWVEGWIEGQRLRITEHDLNLKKRAGAEAWEAYKQGKIEADECMRRWKELGEPEATEKLRRLDEENRKKLIEESTKELEQSRMREEDARARLAESQKNYERAKMNAERMREEVEAARRRVHELREQLAECERRAEEEGRRLRALEEARRRMEKAEERLKERQAEEQVAAEEALAKKAFDDALTAMEELGRVKGGESLANAAKFLKWAGWALEKGKLIADLASGRAAAEILKALRDFLCDPDILTAYRYIHKWNECVGLTEGPFGVISYYMGLGIASRLEEMAKRIPPEARDKVIDYITRMLEEMKR